MRITLAAEDFSNGVPATYEAIQRQTGHPIEREQIEVAKNIYAAWIDYHFTHENNAIASLFMMNNAARVNRYLKESEVEIL